MSLHGDAGYSALLHTISGQKPAVGMNANIGVEYRLFHNNFLFSAGVEGMYELNANRLEDLDVSIPMIDTEGDLFDMHVLVGKSRDITHMVNLNIPLLMGGEWGRFYFLLGPKFSINLYGATSSSANPSAKVGSIRTTRTCVSGRSASSRAIPGTTSRSGG